MNKKLSVIIVTFNEENNIEGCLKSILNQTLKADEIIVVDDGSTDNTTKICKGYPTKIVKNKHKERCYARNCGWKRAIGDYVVFAEGDSVFDRDWIKYIKKSFLDGGDVVSDRRAVYKPDTLLQKCLQVDFDIRYKDYQPFSGWAFKRKVLEVTGGYNESINQSEERELGERVKDKGYKIVFQPKAIQYHKGEPSNLDEFIKRSFKTGYRKAKGYYRIKNKFPWKKEFIVGSLIISLLTGIFVDFFKIYFIVALGLFLGWYAYKIFVKQKCLGITSIKLAIGYYWLRIIKFFLENLGVLVGRIRNLFLI